MKLKYWEKKMLLQYAIQLKEIVGICGINKPIRDYVARHRFVNCLKQICISTDIISESIGDHNLAVNQAYLK